MSRVLRIALMWLVALAVPVQGVAAATMMFCVPQGIPATHEHASHDHGAHHHAVSHDAELVALDKSAEANPSTAAGELDAAGCSVCAACCTTATAPAPSIESDVPKGHAVYHAVVTSSHAIFLTSGLDRPPRLILA